MWIDELVVEVVVNVGHLDVVVLVAVERVVQVIGLVNHEIFESNVLQDEPRFVLPARWPVMQVRLTISSFAVLPKILQEILTNEVEVVEVIVYPMGVGGQCLDLAPAAAKTGVGRPEHSLILQRRCQAAKECLQNVSAYGVTLGLAS